MITLFMTISQWAVPVILLCILGFGRIKKIHLYEVFIQGAMEGIRTTIKLVPYIMAIFIAVGLFRGSGALGFMAGFMKPIFSLLNISPDLFTLGILKPLSGSAALGITAELLQKYGADSTTGITASIIQSSSETTLYVLSLYLGAVHIKDSRHCLIMGLTGELIAFIVAIAIGPLVANH
jgi:spore maturation protein B